MTTVRPDGTPDVEIRPTTTVRSYVPVRWAYDPVTGQRFVLADGQPAYPYPQ